LTIEIINHTRWLSFMILDLAHSTGCDLENQLDRSELQLNSRLMAKCYLVMHFLVVIGIQQLCFFFLKWSGYCVISESVWLPCLIMPNASQLFFSTFRLNMICLSSYQFCWPLTEILSKKIKVHFNGISEISLVKEGSFGTSSYFMDRYKKK